MRPIPTYAEHDDENDEGVHHGEDGGGDGGDHLSQLLDAPEEPDDPQRPHEANEPRRDGREDQIYHGHTDDENIQPVLPRKQILMPSNDIVYTAGCYLSTEK